MLYACSVKSATTAIHAYMKTCCCSVKSATEGILLPELKEEAEDRHRQQRCANKKEWSAKARGRDGAAGEGDEDRDLSLLLLCA